jgi:chaperone modulatory protein CbpM
MGDKNMDQSQSSHAQPELLEGEVLHVEEMARLCGVSGQWLHARIQEEVIHAVQREGRYFLSCTSVWRIQQVFKIERTYDADPQLAGLVADLVQEVRHLRKQLGVSGSNHGALDG